MSRPVPVTHMSVSLGVRALAPVQEAVDHAILNPEHDPFVHLRCVNPDHLAIGTSADNTADRHAKGRDCSGEGHHRAKLTWSSVETIRSSTLTDTELSRLYGVWPSTVASVRANKTWRG